VDVLEEAHDQRPVYRALKRWPTAGFVCMRAFQPATAASQSELTTPFGAGQGRSLGLVVVHGRQIAEISA
jgi:hypothetical protein